MIYSDTPHRCQYHRPWNKDRQKHTHRCHNLGCTGWVEETPFSLDRLIKDRYRCDQCGQRYTYHP